jgi:hypothetical protein
MNAPKGLQIFFANLDYIRVSNDDLVLTLPNGVWWLGNKRLGRVMYVRRCYRELFDLLLADWKKGTDALLIGPDGIGKSMFFGYCLFRLHESNQDFQVVYEHSGFRFLLTSSRGNHFVKIGLASNADFNDQLGVRDTYYFLDGSAPALCATGREAKTMMVCGDDVGSVSLYRQFQKEDGPMTRFMPALAWEEMETLRKRIKFHGESVCKKEAQYRYSKLGGQIRFVLADRHTAATVLVDRQMSLFKDGVQAQIEDVSGEVKKRKIGVSAPDPTQLPPAPTTAMSPRAKKLKK